VDGSQCLQGVLTPCQQAGKIVCGTLTVRAAAAKHFPHDRILSGEYFHQCRPVFRKCTVPVQKQALQQTPSSEGWTLREPPTTALKEFLSFSLHFSSKK